MLTSTRQATQKVVYGLNLFYAGGRNAPLAKFTEPLQSDARTGGDFALTQVGLVHQCIRGFKEVHGPILAKCYPSCKKNITQAVCQNGSTWLDLCKTTQLQGSRPSVRGSRL